MTDQRPNPDDLLKALQNQERHGGQLKIFFGYAAGVGKTYAMLRNAQALKKQGVDVVVGYVEEHGRSETEELLQGLERIPPKEIAYQNVILKELDLEAVLKRKPAVVLVDEFAHTNAPTSRHTKRWQDIDELLKAGIHVHTTVNVQHIASLNDVVSQITGVQVRETVPDAIFDLAAEITLIDISPDELLKRLKEGKVYRSAQAEKALGNYFKKANLIALREIALRRTAQHVHDDVATERTSANVRNIWPTQERLLAVVDSDQAAASAIRAAARLAQQLRAPWIALVVNSPRAMASMPAAQKRLQENIKLTQELGGKIVHRAATFRSAEIVNFAREQNATKIIFSRPGALSIEKWIERIIVFFLAQNIEVLWIPHQSSPLQETLLADDDLPTAPAINYRAYLETTGYVLVSFIIAAVMGLLNAPEANLTVVYLLAVIVAAVIHGEGASAWAAFLSAIILSLDLSNFSWRISWANTQYMLNFGISLGIGLLAANMTSRLKTQAEVARLERELAESLYSFTAELSNTQGLHQIVASAQKLLGSIFERTVVIYLPEDSENFRPLLKGTSALYQSPSEWAVAEWAGKNAQRAGCGTQTLPNAAGLYIPLKGPEGIAGVMALERKGEEVFSHELISRFEKYTHPLAVKLEGATLSENAQKLYWQAERERLRGDLLSSVSQGLKMPLAVLAATANSLGDNDTLSTPERQELLNIIRDESARLERVVDNLTHLTRFETGRLPVNRQERELNEFVQSELFKLRQFTPSDRLRFIPSNTPIQLTVDDALLSQAIFNIVDNAIEHTPPTSAITVKILGPQNQRARIVFEDEGGGIPTEQLERIFEKYYRLNTRSRGVGLGLTVCRAIMDAHGGNIWAENKSPHGLRVTLELPIIRD